MSVVGLGAARRVIPFLYFVCRRNRGVLAQATPEYFA